MQPQAARASIYTDLDSPNSAVHQIFGETLPTITFIVTRAQTKL